MRELIVVDVETTGLHNDSVILEVAAVNVATGAEHHFVPYIPKEAITDAEPKALQINRYFERGVFEHQLSVDGTRQAWNSLSRMLKGNTFGGSNPAFDASMIKWAIGAVWHHRLADLSAYAAGALRLRPTELFGLEKVCEMLQVTNDEPHSALGDARATAECFRKLMNQ